jgi:hypothetical protein
MHSGLPQAATPGTEYSPGDEVEFFAQSLKLKIRSLLLMIFFPTDNR